MSEEAHRGREGGVCVCACRRFQTAISGLLDNESVGEPSVRVCVFAQEDCTPPHFTRPPFPFSAMETLCGCVYV